MKILKFTLFCILCNVFLISQLTAQLLLNLPNNNDECGNAIPQLIIYEVTIEHVIDNHYNMYIQYNETSFESSDYELQINLPSNSGNEFMPFSPTITTLIIVPEPIDEVIQFGCSSNINFRIAKVCGGQETYSNIVSIESINCLDGIHYKKSSFNNMLNEDNNISIAPQPASNIIKIKNYENEFISNASIFSIYGQELLNYNSTSLTSELNLELPKLASGNYIVKIDTHKGNTYFKKLIIK